MTEEARERLITEQLRALATVVLTRRDDLSIVDTRRDTGVDLHVTIEREDKPMRLVFGILLRSVPAPIAPDQANKILKPTMGQFQGLRKFTYPLCLFLFSLREPQALCSWLAEPTVNDGVPILVHHDHAECMLLTTEWLNEFVERIVDWYDAVETVLIA